MWPMKLDMTKEECRGVLRRLELESYGSLISTFRAQGYLCKEKLRILEDLRRILHISNDRHRAEARRASNDERLYTVAEIICGPNSSQDWRQEGHRTFPILPRSVPHTALTYIANTVYEQLTRANCKLVHPASTSCDRLRKAEEDMFKFDLVRKELPLFEKGFQRDAAVVTTDPLQDIMSKSYITVIDKPSDNEQSKPVESPVPAPVEDVPAPVVEKTPDVMVTLEVPTQHEQPSLSDILLDNSPMVPSNSSSSIKSPENPIKSKPVERARKKSLGARRQSKVKSPYPSGKPRKNGPLTRPTMLKVTSIPSPHLMHSYAVPFDVVSATNGGNYYPEPPQLQQHLTSNMPYPISLSHPKTHSSGGYKGGPPLLPPGNYTSPKRRSASPVHSAPHYASQMGPVAHTYKHQQGILPSSKKDIQYNLSKLNPTNSVPMKGLNASASVPMRVVESNVPQPVVKSLPPALLNYQKKTNSKNILIPTSAAAATLLSLGLPPADSTSDWISSFKGREINIKTSRPPPQQSSVPTTPRVTLSTTSSTVSSPTTEVVNERHTATPTGGQERSTGGQSSHGSSSSSDTVSPNTPVQNSELTSTSSDKTSSVVTGPPPAPTVSVPTVPATTASAPTAPIPTAPITTAAAAPTSPVVNNVLQPLKQPNIAGFTPVKSGSKLSISKNQLMPLVAHSPTPAQPGIAKSNVFILPKPNTILPGMLNVGQKISIPKCIIDPAAAGVPAPALTRSPPKVIVQPVPNMTRVVSFEPESADCKEAPEKRPPFAAAAAERLSSETVQSLTPMEIAAGEPVKAVVENAPPSKPSAPLAASISIVPDGAVPKRKITISASQLIPFNGTLRDGTAIPKATISSGTTSGTKQVVLGSFSTATVTAAVATAATVSVSAPTTTAVSANASKASTDWEQEVERANGTGQAVDGGEAVPVATPAISSIEVEKKVEMKRTTAVPSVAGNRFRTISSDSTKVAPVVASGGRTGAATRAGNYDLITTDRGDDSSVTDSAEAEEDPEEDTVKIEEDDALVEDEYDDAHGIIVEEEEANYDSLIEEVAEDENYIEEIVEEHMEISYESSRELMQPTEDIIEEEQDVEEVDEEDHCNMNGIEHDDEVDMHFTECDDTIVDQTIENGDTDHQPPTEMGAHSAKDKIVCQILHLGKTGTYTAQEFSYEQAIAEGFKVPSQAKPSHKTKFVS